MLGFSPLALFGVWIGCSSNTSPVASYSASKTADADTAPASSVFTIPDAKLKSAIRTALGRPASDSTSAITESDLASLKALTAKGKGIVNLLGLEQAVNLEYLNLADNSITDLSPLVALSKLKYLYLESNSIADLTPVVGLPKLEDLRLTTNSITDISVLTGSFAYLPKLEYLYLASNSITDLSPLADLPKLKRLTLGGNPFGGDLSDLAGLTELEWLMVNWTGVTDLSPVEGLTKLTFLDISSNSGITDFSPLTCLVPTLKNLKLRGMPLLSEIVNGVRVPKQDQPDLLYLAAKGVAIGWGD